MIHAVMNQRHEQPVSRSPLQADGGADGLESRIQNPELGVTPSEWHPGTIELCGKCGERVKSKKLKGKRCLLNLNGYFHWTTCSNRPPYAPDVPVPFS